MFSLLSEQFSDDTAAMAYWIRKVNAVLQTTLLLSMVDQGRQKGVTYELQGMASVNFTGGMDSVKNQI